jgi:hypothetical protein
MLCISLNNYAPACGGNTGGVSRAWVFDPYDWNFTAGAAVNGQPTGYSALALRIGTGAALGTVGLTSTTVTSVPVTTGGTNYPYATIPITFTGGGGTGATAYANVVGGIVVSVTITAAGTGYASAPVATLSASGATAAGGGKLYPVNFMPETGEYSFDNPNTENYSVKYEHTFTGQLLNLSQDLTNYLATLNQGGACCGLGVIMELNNGKILVMGESYVAGSAIKPFRIKMSNKGGSGKKYEDFNGTEVSFNGAYVRPLYEYTGGVAALLALQ